MCGAAISKEIDGSEKGELTKRTSAVACKSSNCHLGTAAGIRDKTSNANLFVFVREPMAMVELLALIKIARIGLT